MYKVDYMPILMMCDIVDAVEKRFGRSLETSDLFGDEYMNGVYCSYFLDRDKELSEMSYEEAAIYIFVKTVINKDFGIYTPQVLVDVSW